MLQAQNTHFVKPYPLFTLQFVTAFLSSLQIMRVSFQGAIYWKALSLSFIMLSKTLPNLGIRSSIECIVI